MRRDDTPSAQNRFAREFFRAFAVVFLPLMALLIGEFIVVTGREVRLEIQAARTRAQWAIETSSQIIDQVTSEVAADLLHLADSPGIHDWFTVLSESENAHGISLIAADYRSFVGSRGIFDQARLIDAAGMEIVRVNYSEGSAVVVPAEDLQFKGDRYYFTDALALRPREIYVSRLDLNVEQGRIEQPIKPMIRFATPVADSEGVARGVVVLNYLAQDMLDYFRNLFVGFEFEVYLADAAGYWLIGPSREEEWRFMFPDEPDVGLHTEHPAFWAQIQSSSAGSFETDAGAFEYGSITPLRADWTATLVPENDAPAGLAGDEGDYRWVAVAFLSREALQRIRATTITTRLSTAGLYFIVVLCLSGLVAAFRVRRRVSERAVLESAAALRTANASKDRLFSILAHDLRGPIGSMALLAEQALEVLREQDTEQAEQILQAIVTATRRDHRMLENLLLWARSQLGHIEVEACQLSVDSLAAEITGEAAAAAEQKGIHLAVELGTPDLSVHADANMIRTVFRNLISNAIKFTPAGGTVTVTTERDKDTDELLVFVKDTGIGIPVSEQANLLELTSRFRRPGTAGEPSSGLGLVLCREFLEIQGGTLSVESVEGKGSTFVMRLPAA